MNDVDFEINIKVTKNRGFYVQWKTAAGDIHDGVAINRSVLGRMVLIEAVPEVRGDLPKIDETIDIHAPTARRAGDT